MLKIYDYDPKLHKPLKKLSEKIKQKLPLKYISTKHFEEDLIQNMAEKKAYEEFNKIVSKNPSQQEYLKKLKEINKKSE